MEIGDEVYVHGYVDEVCNGTVIIKNKGGYFCTSTKEVSLKAEVEDDLADETECVQIVYPMNKFSVAVGDGQIVLFNKRLCDIKVMPQSDCLQE